MSSITCRSAMVQMGALAGAVMLSDKLIAEGQASLHVRPPRRPPDPSLCFKSECRTSSAASLPPAELVIANWNLGQRRLKQSMRFTTRQAIVFAIFSLAMAASLSLSGCHAKPSLTPQEAEGKHLYQVRCAHCHEDNDLSLKKVPPTLQALFSQSTLPSGAPATDTEV